MITRRKFFSMMLMMGVILFLFLFSQVSKEVISDYDTNSYAEEPAVSGSSRWEAADHTSGEVPGSASENRSYIVLIGDEKNDTGKIVSQWCLYTKRELVVCRSLKDCSVNDQSPPELLLLDSKVIDYGKETEELIRFAEQGIHMVFCNLPDVSVIQSQADLRALLGIQYVGAEEVKVEGVHLFGDFFLGGSYIYRPEREEDEKRQDLQLEIPWYVTLSGTKTYMVGILDEMLEEEEAKNEYFPGIIWRNSYGDARIFAVNGDYMSDSTGIGILSAMVYETESYDLYPVINAQNLLMIDYPEFAEENAEAMQEIYSRTPRIVQQDIIWPTLLTTVRRSGWKLTCFLSPQYDYMDHAEPSSESLPFYLQQFKEIGAEAGISLRHSENITLTEKAAADEDFYRLSGKSYVYSAAYADVSDFQDLEEAAEREFTSAVRTIACEQNPDTRMVFYYNDAVTGQNITGDARTHTYSENIRLRSLETALGYSNVKIDMHEVMWPESEETHWENFYRDVASNLDTWWKPFAAFEKTTLTESDRRLRTFLNLDYSKRREDNWIYLDVKGTEEDSWFLLRTHGEAVAEVRGAEYQQIEENAYLLHVLGNHAEVRVEKNRGILKYTMPGER